VAEAVGDLRVLHPALVVHHPAAASAAAAPPHPCFPSRLLSGSPGPGARFSRPLRFAVARRALWRLLPTPDV
jgi:hypothetical protein